MANHQKAHIFVKIISTDKSIVCINPHNLSSFAITPNKKISYKDGTSIQADSLDLYYPQGTGLSYSVGINITKENFDYVCGTLAEFVYLNEYELKLKVEAIEKTNMDEWTKLSEENSKKLEG